MPLKPASLKDENIPTEAKGNASFQHIREWTVSTSTSSVALKASPHFHKMSAFHPIVLILPSDAKWLEIISITWGTGSWARIFYQGEDPLARFLLTKEKAGFCQRLLASPIISNDSSSFFMDSSWRLFKLLQSSAICTRETQLRKNCSFQIRCWQTTLTSEVQFNLKGKQIHQCPLSVLAHPTDVQFPPRWISVLDVIWAFLFLNHVL